MPIEKIPFSQTNSFSGFFLDYIDQNKHLKPFYNRYPSIDSFKDQIAEKKKNFNNSFRQVLSTTLEAQYKDIDTSPLVKDNIKKLNNDSTFTITTGHQLNLFTGPLYFIYKIVSVINTCRLLQKAYPKNHFVPVYWMASEDHDFDEIKYFRLDGKKYVWESNQTGAVGRFDPSELKVLLEQIPGNTKVFKDAYLKHASLSDAVRYYVNELFGDEGLIVVDADHRNLKSLFKNVLKDDLNVHSAKKKVDVENKKLEQLGYSVQVHAREINLFYLDKSLRSRIEKQDDQYKVVDTELSFSSNEVEKIIVEEPEKLSPNVILRPVYQEAILPNLAYIGGPAEVVYWLQLKSTFEHFGITFPIVMPRNFAMVIDAPLWRKFEKTKLTIADLFTPKDELLTHWTMANAQHDLSTLKEIKEVDSMYSSLLERAHKLDPTLDSMVKAEQKRIQSSLTKIEKKMIRAEKRFQQDKLGQISALKDSLFPSGSPQERVDNFLNFYQQDSGFLRSLLDKFDPFDFRMNIVTP